MDLVTLSLAKKYANSIASGIKSYSVDGLTLKIVTTSGQTLTMNFPSPKVKDIDITVDGYIIFTLEDGTEIKSEEAIPSAKISAQPGNSIFQKEDGLYVPAGAVDISEDEGNAIETRENGLYVATRGGGGGSAEETTYDNSFSQLPQVDNVQTALNKLTGGTSDIITYKITTASTGGSDASLDIQRNNASPVRLLYTNKVYEVANEIKVVYEGRWYIYCLADKMIYNNVTYTKGQQVAVWEFQISQNITTTIPGSYHRGLFEQNAEEVEYDNSFSLIDANNVQTTLDKITGGINKNGFYHLTPHPGNTAYCFDINKNDGANTYINGGFVTSFTYDTLTITRDATWDQRNNLLWHFTSSTFDMEYNNIVYPKGTTITVKVNRNNSYPEMKFYFIETIKGLIDTKIDEISFSAEDITYDNTTSELEATNVQDAIDEIIEDRLSGIQFAIDGEGNRGYLKADGSFAPFKSFNGDLFNHGNVKGFYNGIALCQSAQSTFSNENIGVLSDTNDKNSLFGGRVSMPADASYFQIADNYTKYVFLPERISKGNYTKLHAIIEVTTGVNGAYNYGNINITNFLLYPGASDSKTKTLSYMRHETQYNYAGTVPWYTMEKTEVVMDISDWDEEYFYVLFGSNQNTSKIYSIWLT